MTALEVSGGEAKEEKKDSNYEGGAFFSIRNPYRVESVLFLAFQLFTV